MNGQTTPPAVSGTPGPDGADAPSLEEMIRESGLQRVLMLAWRDLEDPEAGGSEVHADKVAERWARAGLEVVQRTARAQNHPDYKVRNGYQVIRKAGRYAVFPRSAAASIAGRNGSYDGLVEIWNGMPFLSPVWSRKPRIVFLHHVHAEMWRMVLPPHMARVGETIESKLAPPLYRRSEIVTLSESSRHEIISMLHMRPEKVTVVPPGISPRFSPGGERSVRPLVVAVGRLVPVKRFDRLIRGLLAAKALVPELEAEIVGEGYERENLQEQIDAAGATEWLRLVGRVDDDELVRLYRRAWVVASASAREGWGMTLTEAAACGTPAVATRIAGHSDAVADGISGLLVDDVADLGQVLASVLNDPALRAALVDGALKQAEQFTWDATALGTFAVLAGQAARRNRSRR
ncbi:MAG TPA: glycosyltransferase family 4 protein [Frankiaceae bacterium]|nr:glycosyltransferase family 4 protein [Frankiaceae bacterium]